MIIIPLKRTDAAQWSTHLSPAISSVYGSDSNFKAEIEALDHLRNVMAGAAPNESGRDLLFRYYSQLELLSLHVPVKKVQTTFTWHNLYNKHFESLSSLAFEKCCVAFNLAASLSAVGAENFKKGDFKSSYHAFSCSAGVFHEIASIFVNCPSVDVQPETVGVLSKLMQAQAQHCFYLKASESQKAPGLEAKLAKGAINLYTDAKEGLNKLLSEKWGDKNFIKQIDSSLCELQGAANRAQAMQLEKTHGYGSAISHLQEAKKFISDKAEVQEIDFKIRILEKDNDLIYHDRIPAQVPEIQATVVAKLLTMSEIYPEDQAAKLIGKDIFERMVPVSVHEKASVYSELKTQHLREQQEKSQIADLEITSALEYMNLPQAVSEFKRANHAQCEVPSEVIEWSNEIRNLPLDSIELNFKPRRDRILQQLNAQAATSDASGATTAVKQSLVKAAQSDTTLSQLKLSYKSDIDNLGKLSHISQLFENIGANLNDPSAQLNLLDLDATNTSGSNPQQFEQNLNDVSNLVAKLHKIMSERSNTLKELKTEIMNDDALDILIAHQKDEDLVENVLKPQLKKFDSKVHRIEATIRLQSTVLEKISELWKAVLESGEGRRRLTQKKQVEMQSLKLEDQLRDVYTQYNVIKDGARRADQFYSNLEQQLGIHTANFNFNSNFSGGSVPPNLPPKLPPKDDMSSYSTPSTYDRSMYQ